MLIVFVFILFHFSLFASTPFEFTSPQSIVPYLKKFLPISPIIVEAGAYDGSDSVLLSMHFPYGKIYCFEPVPELFKKVIQKTAPYQNITASAFALAEKSGTATFYLSALDEAPDIVSASSSLLPPKDHLIHSPYCSFKNTITVNTITLDECAEKNGIDHVDFMWLDMQGSEMHMLKASKNILKTVKVILTEVEYVEAYEGQYLYQDIKEFLESEGFTLVAISGLGKNWFGDALFVRTTLLP